MIFKPSVLKKNKEKIKKMLQKKSVAELEKLRSEWLGLHQSATENKLKKSAEIYKFNADIIQEVIKQKIK